MMLKIDASHVQNLGEEVLADLENEKLMLLEYRQNGEAFYSLYECARRESNSSWKIMVWACNAMGIDISKLIATIKAMNRQTKKLNWNKGFSLKDHQIGGLLKEGNVFMQSFHDGESAYRVRRFLP